MLGLAVAPCIWGITVLRRFAGCKTPTVIIDADGVEIVHATNGCRIAWAQIETTYIRKIRHGAFQEMRCLCFKLRDPEQLTATAKTGWQRMLLRQGQHLMGTPFAITDHQLDAPVEDVQLEIENRLYARRKAQELSTPVPLPDVPDIEPLRVGAR